LPYDGMTASIPKLIARLRFLEAHSRYHEAICPPELRHVAPNIRYRGEERDEIMQRLAKAVPDCFDDASALLEFATARLRFTKAFDSAELIVGMLKNARTGFFKAHVTARLDYALRTFDEVNQFAG